MTQVEKIRAMVESAKRKHKGDLGAKSEKWAVSIWRLEEILQGDQPTMSESLMLTFFLEKP